MNTNAVTVPPIRLAGVEGVLSCIPSFLKFHPADSLVMVCLAGERRRVGPVVRIDLLSIPGTETHLADIARQYADEAIVVAYTDAPAPDLSVLTRAIERACPVLDVVVTSNGPHQVDETLRAATAISTGGTILATRADLARSVEHRPGLPTEAVAEILARLSNTAERDDLLHEILRDSTQIARLISAAQTTPDSDSRTPEVCAVLAVVAYRHGDGALAQVAIDRTLRLHPDHRLAHLMLAVMAAGITPSALDDVTIPVPPPADSYTRPKP